MPKITKEQRLAAVDLLHKKTGLDVGTMTDHYRRIVFQRLEGAYRQIYNKDVTFNLGTNETVSAMTDFLNNDVGVKVSKETLRDYLSYGLTKGKEPAPGVSLRRTAYLPSEAETPQAVPSEPTRVATNMTPMINSNPIQPRKPKMLELTEEEKAYREEMRTRREADIEAKKLNEKIAGTARLSASIGSTVEQMTAVADAEFTNHANPDNAAPDNQEIAQAIRDEFQANQDVPVIDIPVITPSDNISTADASETIAPSAPQQPPAGEPQFINPSYVKPQPLGTFYLSQKGPVFATTELQQIAATNQAMLEIDFNTPAGKKYIADKLKQVDEISKYIDEIRNSDNAGVNGANPLQIARDIVKKNAGLSITPVQSKPQFIRGQTYNPSNVPYSIF